jgi:L-alanine-DL-glutamate epimerase-like enolase superfamily enzyme
VVILEHCHGYNPLLRELAPEQFPVVDGGIEVSDAPGLGVTLNPEAVARYTRPWKT